jgi:spermidine synthase
MAFVLYLIFFLSGAAALLFETLWFHQAGLVLGNSVWASSVVLAGFMCGLSLGNGVAGRYGGRVLQPLRLYAFLELTIAATGIALVHGIPRLTPIVVALLRPVLDAPMAANAIRLGLAFGFLLIPSTAMGATLPLLVAHLYRREPHFGRVLGRLYGWNTLGAVAGAVSGHAALFAWFGISGSARVAAALNLAAALGAFALSRRLEAAKSDTRESQSSVLPPLPARTGTLLVAAALCGGTLLALEVVWFRFLILFTLPGSMAFALMLAVVLLGIGAGGLVAARTLSFSGRIYGWLPVFAATSGIFCVASYGLFDELASHVAGDFQRWWVVVGFGLFLMFPVSLLSGVLFTLIGEAVNRAAPSEVRTAGLLTLANTTGAALGSLAGGFLLLPGLGIERSVRLLAVTYGVTSVCLALGVRRSGRRAENIAFAATATALLAVVGPLFPSGLMERRYLTYPIRRFTQIQERLVAARETLTETLLYLRWDIFGEVRHYRLVTNSHSMSSTSFQSQRYMRLFVYLPIALHPAPKSALLISYGVGATAKALTDTHELERIDMVDISRDVLDMNRIVYPDEAAYPPADPRVTVHIEDGRQFLQTTDRRFDVITGEPPPPKAAGIVNLYTREFFSLAKDRLEEGGIFTYWLPVHALTDHEARAILRAFCDVFDDCSLWSGSALNWVMMGTRRAMGPGSAERFARQWHDPVVVSWLRDLGFEVPEQLGALFVADAEVLRGMTLGTEPLEDDHPKRLGESVLLPADQVRIFGPWLDPEITRHRFEESALVRRLWPPELREATLPYFEFQSRIDDYLLGGLAEERTPRDLPRVDRVLRGSTLSTLALWEMKTNVDLQRPAHMAYEKGRRGPLLEFERGARALAHRNYLEAAGRFGAAQDESRTHREALHYRLYALCMAGRTAEARRVAAREGIASGKEPGDLEAWSFLQSRFALSD